MREVCKEYGNVLIAMTGTFSVSGCSRNVYTWENGVIALLIRTYMGG